MKVRPDWAATSPLWSQPTAFLLFFHVLPQETSQGIMQERQQARIDKKDDKKQGKKDSKKCGAIAVQVCVTLIRFYNHYIFRTAKV